MKYAVAALLGLTAAKYDDAMDALKISVNPFGQKVIEKNVHDVENVAHKIHNKPATKQLRNALKKWAQSGAAQRVHQLDQKFLASKAGKKLIKEWKDVGRVLHENVKHTEQSIHFNNKAMKQLSNELDDVSDHYEYLGTTHWAAKYDQAYKNLFTNQAFKGVKKAGKKFEHSAAGRALGKEVHELGAALKTHVKVTDVPKKWKKHMHGLKIEVDADGEKEIQQEAADVAEWWKHTANRPVTQGLKKHLMEWDMSDEMRDLKQLDRKFMRSPDGQKLMKEWRDFGEALRAAIVQTPNGIHINNDALDEVEDEVEDIDAQYKHLETTHWNEDYHQAFDSLFHNAEAQRLGHYVETKWNPSREAKRGAKELHEFGQAIHDNVEVSDVPEHWKEAMEPQTMLATTYGVNRGEAIGTNLPAKFITSMNNRYRLTVQTDGRVVILKSFNNWANQVAIWGVGPYNAAGVANPQLVHQQDGNVVLYHNNVAKWATNTVGKITTRLIMQNDGNLVLYWGARALWASNTRGK